MKARRFVAILVAFSLAPVAVCAGEITQMSLRSGHSIVLPEPGLTRVAVGDARIAGAAPLGTRDVLVSAKSPGHTNLFIWRGKHRVDYEVTVSEQTVDDVASMIRSAISDPGVQVISVNRSIMLKGVVQTPQELNSLNELLIRFEPDAKANKYSLVNAVGVAQPLGGLQSNVAAMPGASDVHVDRDEKGNLIVSGRVLDRVIAEQVLDRVRQTAGAYLNGDAKVLDRLGIDTTSQVDVKVYILEVDRTALQQLGVRLQSAIPDVNHPGFYILSDPSFPSLESDVTNFSNKPNTGPGIPGRTLNIGAFYRTTVLAPTLDLIQRTGHARMLSAPDLVTMPGREATFLVGGEIPIPYASGPQQIAIVYKEFGVRLLVTPNILGNGGVETRIAPEVSDLDFADGIIASGFSIPALKTSKLSTDVVTHPGESIIMGGLLRRQEIRNIDKIPLLGDIPILGKLFRSTRYQKAETDVVFIMTPQVLTR